VTPYERVVLFFMLTAVTAVGVLALAMASQFVSIILTGDGWLP